MGKRRGRRAEGDTRDTGWPKTNAARRGGGRVREEGGETEVGGRTGEGRGKAEVEVGRGSEGRRASREQACWVDG